MAKEILERGCGNCHFLTGCYDQSGRRVVRASKAYGCSHPIPEKPAVPAAYDFLIKGWTVTNYDHETKTNIVVPAPAGYVFKDSGKTCPTWKPWKE